MPSSELQKIKTVSTLLVLIYIVISLTTIALWHQKKINGLTGDEPHYLVITSGIVKHLTLEQSKPYTEEFNSRAIFSPGLAPAGEKPSPANTHAVLGPRGLYNVHNIGLPLMLAVPFGAAGVLGSKLFLVLINSLLFWVLSKAFLRKQVSQKILFLSILPFSIATNFVIASGQIYPDLIAGILILFIFISAAETTSSGKNRDAFSDIPVLFLLSLLPWLQLKFTGTVIVVMTFLMIKRFWKNFSISKVLTFMMPVVISISTLALYNNYAFGNLFGPYDSTSLQLSKTSLMVGVGLLLDQNQGLFFQNPLNLLGFAYILYLIRQRKSTAILALVIIASSIVPNAMHPNWYGGGSFSGRFTWTVAPLLAYFSVKFLIEISKKRVTLFYIIVTISVVLQLYFWVCYAYYGVSLYNKQSTIGWVSAYSIFFPFLSKNLPSFYNSEWAFNFLPNLILTAGILALCVAILFPSKRINRLVIAILIMGSAIVCTSLIVPMTSAIAEVPKKWSASQLPSQTGMLIESSRYAKPGRDLPGFLTFGPYDSLAPGNYAATITYVTKAQDSAGIGYVDVYDNQSSTQVRVKRLFHTKGKSAQIRLLFRINGVFAHRIEVRTYWEGEAYLKILRLELEPA
jgi:hypothetical protein